MSQARRHRRQAGKHHAAKPGGGPYDAIAERALRDTEARAVLLLVLDGKHGNGFTVQELTGDAGPQIVGRFLVDVLRNIADQIEAGAEPDSMVQTELTPRGEA